MTSKIYRGSCSSVVFSSIQLTYCVQLAQFWMPKIKGDRNMIKTRRIIIQCHNSSYPVSDIRISSRIPDVKKGLIFGTTLVKTELHYGSLRFLDENIKGPGTSVHIFYCGSKNPIYSGLRLEVGRGRWRGTLAPLHHPLTGIKAIILCRRTYIL